MYAAEARNPYNITNAVRREHIQRVTAIFVHHAYRRTSFEWKLPVRGRITNRHYRQPKLPNFLYSSNRLFGGEAADAGNAVSTFCFSVPVITNFTTLTVQSLWTELTETAKHLIFEIDETS